MFELQPSPIDAGSLKKEFNSGAAGAFAAFEGWVRDRNEGQKVLRLEYEAYPELCRAESDKILTEAAARFQILRARCVHRTGVLEVGELAVWVGVTAAHREDAFAACRYIIDEIKSRLPIWKKEHYADGKADWVNCRCGHAHKGPAIPAALESEYYSRQLKLPEVGTDGQDKLKAAKVLVVGAGGLGCSALTSLAQAGIGTLGICESDALEASNVHRQGLYRLADTGQDKLVLAAKALKELNPFVTIREHSGRLTAENIEDVLKGYDCLLDCSDNFTTKFLLNDAAFLFQKPLIQASIYQWEGQLRVYIPKDKGPCLRCLWSKTPQDNCVGTCQETGVMGVVPAVFGHLQALEAVKFVLGLPVFPSGEMLFMDLASYRQQRLKIERSPSCPLCSAHPSIIGLAPEPQNADPLEVDLGTLTAGDMSRCIFIDIREPMELMINPISNINTVHLPLSCFPQWDYIFEKDRQYLVFCEKGMRSLMVVERLKKDGHTNLRSVTGGVDAIRRYAGQKTSV